MGFQKRKFEGKYSEWYNTISANSGANPKLDSYSSIGNLVSSMDWQGEGKESICGVVESIDASCEDIYNSIQENIFKVEICTGPLLSSLLQLKNKIEEYNALIDEYYAALAEIERKRLQNHEEVY